jgi:hypothetical protein
LLMHERPQAGASLSKMLQSGSKVRSRGFLALPHMLKAANDAVQIAVRSIGILLNLGSRNPVLPYLLHIVSPTPELRAGLSLAFTRLLMTSLLVVLIEAFTLQASKIVRTRLK